MTFTSPSPQSWTLRLKSRKTTVLLHVDPLHTFSTIKSQLYAALQDTGFKDSDGTETTSLPPSPSDIQLGVPVSKDDPRLGFQLGEWEYSSLEEDDTEDVKGKGKAKAGRPKKPGDAAGVGSVKDCPKGAGLRDGAVLAFRWRGDGNDWLDEEDEDLDMEGDATKGGSGKKPNMWGVKLATFEDSYGVENETDLGGRREFEG